MGLVWRIFTQGVALGYVLLPLRGVLLVSFDTLSAGSVVANIRHSAAYASAESCVRLGAAEAGDLRYYPSIYDFKQKQP